MLHIKFVQDWPTGLRDIHVWKCKYIRNFLGAQGHVNSKVTNPIRPEFELVKDFMPVLVTSRFDEDPIKNECATVQTPFSHYKSMGIFLDAQGHLTLKGVVRSGQNSNSSEILCHSSLPASLTKIGSKLKVLAWQHSFPHYQSMGAFCCHGNHSFDGICSKT